MPTYIRRPTTVEAAPVHTIPDALRWVETNTTAELLGHGDDWATWRTWQPEPTSLQTAATAGNPRTITARLGDYLLMRDARLHVMTAREFEQTYQ